MNKPILRPESTPSFIAPERRYEVLVSGVVIGRVTHIDTWHSPPVWKAWKGARVLDAIYLGEFAKWQDASAAIQDLTKPQNQTKEQS